MTKEEIDELGSMAMKVINDHPLTAEEEERFKELQEKLDGMASGVDVAEKKLGSSSDGGSSVINADPDVSSPKLEG